MCGNHVVSRSHELDAMPRENPLLRAEGYAPTKYNSSGFRQNRKQCL